MLDGTTAAASFPRQTKRRRQDPVLHECMTAAHCAGDSPMSARVGPSADCSQKLYQFSKDSPRAATTPMLGMDPRNKSMGSVWTKYEHTSPSLDQRSDAERGAILSFSAFYEDAR